MSAALYYTNAAGDKLWESLNNWNTAADGSGDYPTEVPWSGTDGSTSAFDLIDETSGAGITIAGSTTIDPSYDVTGTCSIPNITFNSPTINGGTWSADNLNLESSNVNGGTFTGNNCSGGNVNGGTFSGSGYTPSGDYITGGTFEITGMDSALWYSYAGAITFSALTMLSAGSPFTGQFANQVWHGGAWWLDGTNLYYTNDSADSDWGNPANWNYDAGGGGNTPTEAPWSNNDGTTNESNLIRISGTDSVNINQPIDPVLSVTGTCSIPNVFNSNTIHGGSWSGISFINNGTIAGGTFEITDFQQNGTITYSAIHVTSSGSPFTGLWQFQNWSAGAWVSSQQGTSGTWYYTNQTEDQNWFNIGNWNTHADASGLYPTEVPWSGTDHTTDASNLLDATSGAGVNLQSNSPLSGGVFATSATGTCSILNITSTNSQIGGGTWTGTSFVNGSGSAILNGTFSGNNLTCRDSAVVAGGNFNSLGTSSSGGRTLITLPNSNRTSIVFSIPTPSGGGGGKPSINIGALIGLPPIVSP